MIPATCFLVSALLQVIPVDEIYFSEGGVRQGLCYELLPHSEQIKDPLIEGVKSYVSHLPYALSSSEYNVILDILKKAIPPLYLSPDHPLQLFRLLPAAVHLANLTTHYPKETRAFVSFYTPLAGGPLANIPGLLHSERAILALILAYRQGGEVPDPNFSAIENMIGKHGTSVCKYVGRLMEVMFLISPRQPGRGILESGLQFRLARPDSSSEDDEDPMTPISKSFYSSAILEIIFPQKTSQILEAPAVLSVFENMDKKIQPKKFELDQENESLDPSSKLFTVNIIRESSDESIARNA
jgi:retrograde regulation protein 2